ncbi:hypothetical protein MNAN1_000128 [Malassezia nana]|uniref:Small ribosomal subunit protein mS23 n=1 Tax=Malassezia nana TaxID=180528 RepID=A0AAF0J0V0_9BASI|nr:hypothetical protein MNAN1_000128 [Malassezia nana]
MANQAFTRAMPSSPPTHTETSFSSLLAMQQAGEPLAQGIPMLDGQSPPAHGRTRSLSIPGSSNAPRILQPFNTDSIRILLLENVSQGAVKMLREQGFEVDFFTGAWSEEELISKIGDYHAIGIRSKTRLTKRVFDAAHQLLVVGCFCIGTNQVDLEAASKRGIAVFNSPFANSRSVAELVIGELVCLARQLADRSMEMRNGTWNKVSKGCYELRGKLLGIVGYGHIGSQLSVLAEAMGMRVIYHDVLPLMPLGSARQAESLEELLGLADFVSIHVPELPETRGMIGAKQLAQMKPGSYLINNARGTVVDIPALIEALKSKHLAGCAIDVFPKEPAKNGENTFNNDLNAWASELQKQSNVIMTPHIGGSTEEAQRLIGIEVGNALCRYINFGGSVGAVNFPEVNIRPITEQETRSIRICYVHLNQPGALLAVNEIIGRHNVDKQSTDSLKDIAYLLADISDVSESDIQDIYTRLSKTPANILTVSRLLQGGYMKEPPAWYEATLRHPPLVPPPHQTRQRPDDDLPRMRQSAALRQPHDKAAAIGGRSKLNSRKKIRSQMPPLRPQPIVYEADRIRRQFFRDHPWESKRPQTLAEMDYTLETTQEPEIPVGTWPELSMWSRIHPSVEDVIQCTLKTREVGGVSLSDAYRRTIASYHAIQAERELRLRYANLEARSLGADMGPSETERGFMKEARELDKWAASSTAASTLGNTQSSGPAARDKRVKRVLSEFTGGDSYMASASSVSHGQGAPMDPSTAHASATSSAQAEASPSPDDYLGIGASLHR